MKKRELVQMLMAMDRYNVDSVVMKTANNRWSWEIESQEVKPRTKPSIL